VNTFDHVLNFAGLVHTDGYFAWMKDIFEFTIHSINDHADGWYDEVLNDTFIDHQIADPKCEASTSVDSYNEIKKSKELKGAIHAVIGPRCSEGAVETGKITSTDKIVQVTPIASSTMLSEKSYFPFVSRLVAPGNQDGEVGAMVAMLIGFGWERISIISTDSQYSKAYVYEFKQLWNQYEIASHEVIPFNDNHSIHEESMRLALTNTLIDDPNRNSRVVLLLAYSKAAYTIIKIAEKLQLKKDTIWVGTGSWPDRNPKLSNFYVPTSAGQIGLTPFSNRDDEYTSYLNRFQSWQRKENKTVWKELPHYAAGYLIDSIVSVAKAFSQTPRHLRDDANNVTMALRDLSYDGVSGHVSFTQEGDR
jgi:ABC-type branched-subunit amino acid transport system substrate-binding protein